MKKYLSFLACGIILIFILLVIPNHLQGQNDVSHYLSGKINMSKIAFGKEVSGISYEQRLKYYAPAGFGLGVELGYERRQGNFGLEGDLILRNLKFYAEEIFEYDFYTKPYKALSSLAIQAQLLGKVYFINTQPVSLNFQFGMAASYNEIFIMYQRPRIVSPNTWGVHTLSGVAANFRCTERMMLTIGARHTYQINGFHDEGYKENSSFDRFEIWNSDHNNHVVVFSVGVIMKVNQQ